MLDTQLLGKFIDKKKDHDFAKGSIKYLALHLRFEVDMVAYSLCEFGGGESERRKLQAYRESQFPLLVERLKNSTSPISPMVLRKMGRCPLTPEEASLVLAGLGFKRGTYVYLAGSGIYGADSRMNPFTRLYPNVITKEDFLARLLPMNLNLLRNFLLSQISTMVFGFKSYYGGDHVPILRPNKKRLAAILWQNGTIGWNSFEERVKRR
ncbi:uncharacterized protein DS421_15g490300 [Arachis hypogaea]|nr:uncharacterized protein DS421_15g490300 [Arachis hypogaea]